MSCSTSGSATAVSRSSRLFRPASKRRGPLWVTTPPSGTRRSRRIDPAARREPAGSSRRRLSSKCRAFVRRAPRRATASRAASGPAIRSLISVSTGPSYSTTRTFMSMRSLGLSRPSRGAPTIWSATSIPRTTRPKAVYCRSRNAESATQMKNWQPARGPLHGARQREDPALVEGVVELRLDRVPGAAGAVALPGSLQVLRVGVAPLDHEAGNHPVERGPVVEALLGQVDEVLDVARGLVGQELQLDLPELRL